MRSVEASENFPEAPDNFEGEAYGNTIQTSPQNVAQPVDNQGVAQPVDSQDVSQKVDNQGIVSSANR